MAEAIRKIERGIQPEPEEDLIEDAIVRLPASPPAAIQRFADAVTEHRENLPSILDALISYVAQEIDRLQFRNAPFPTPEEEVEAQRQIRVLTTICATLQKLQQTIPVEGAMTPQEIERGEKLSRLFVRSFREWPQKNAEDIVDSTCRAALVGLTATLAPLIGISATVAAAVGVVIFGGKKVADGIKTAKELGGLDP